MFLEGKEGQLHQDYTCGHTTVFWSQQLEAGCENKLVSHIKFTIKDGFADDFLAAQAKVGSDPLFAALPTFTIQPDENVFTVTNIYDDIDQVMSILAKAFLWLDEIKPLLVCTEDGSRTKAWSRPTTFGRCEATPCDPTHSITDDDCYAGRCWAVNDDGIGAFERCTSQTRATKVYWAN